MASPSVPAGAVSWLNNLEHERAVQIFAECCGSKDFAEMMSAQRPFHDVAHILETCRDTWWNKVNTIGWLQAFSAHPQIGDIQGLKAKFSDTSKWCEGEQSEALKSADEAILKDLAEWNKLYFTKFGFVFLICATGKSSLEVLTQIKFRYPRTPLEELQAAAAEQQKITEIRLYKALQNLPESNRPSTASSRPWHSLSQPKGALASASARLSVMESHLQWPPVSVIPPIVPADCASKGAAGLRPPITTHVLDVALGKPAAGVSVTLQAMAGSVWKPLGQSVTDEDGRSGALMAESEYVRPGEYRLTFGVGEYLRRQGIDGFYQNVNVDFLIKEWQSREHFHVPILLSPFSFSTYRGS